MAARYRPRPSRSGTQVGTVGVALRCPVVASPTDALPHEGDLPAGRWMAIDEGFDRAAGPGGDAAELIDCVGEDFPSHAIVDAAATPHWVALDAGTPRLVHGVGVLFADDASTVRAADVLTTDAFAECLGRSVVGDLAGAPGDAEVLVAEVSAGSHGRRVSFHGSDGDGMRSVHLDVTVVRVERCLGIWWLADSPDPFPAEVTRGLIDAVTGRARGGDAPS